MFVTEIFILQSDALPTELKSHLMCGEVIELFMSFVR